MTDGKCYADIRNDVEDCILVVIVVKLDVRKVW